MTTKKIFLTVLTLVLAASLCPAEVQKTDSDAAQPAPPYVAEIVGSDVYVRSGPGTAYYFCSKLNEPARVIVVGKTYGWSKIVPPDGSFSWISKNYVRLDPTNPTIGFITGDNVRVWAGSNYEVPMRSSSLQTKLSKDEIVTIIKQEQDKGDYYKISPPTGAHLWINSQYLKYAGPVPKIEPGKLPPKPQTVTQEKPSKEPEPEKAKTEKIVPVEKTKTTDVKPPKQPKVTSDENKKIEQCSQVEEKIKAELSKPIEKQNYDLLKNELKSIANDKKAGKAQNYANFLLERIARIELAAAVGDELKRQDAELAKALERIKKKYEEKIAKIPSIEKFVITGTLKPSQIYTASTRQKRYIILNEAGKIQCYAIPTNSAAEVNAQNLINQKVGLVGKISSDSQSSVSLVEFTQAVSL
jgi:uncharacterized protein YgiM (DUF1202 family)